MAPTQGSRERAAWARAEEHRALGLLRSVSADRAFGLVGAAAAAALGLTLVVVAVSVARLAWPSVREVQWSFLASSIWDPSRGAHGALAFVWGTVLTSLVALLLAVPVSLGVAVFLTDLGPRPLRRWVSSLVELLAAIPSVVYGLWAALVLAPVLRSSIEPALARIGGPLFSGPQLGVGILCASIVLAIMVLPTIASVSRDVLAAVPAELREGALALGATPWDVVRTVAIPHARRGILGAVLLGFGRAVGETMAVAAVVGSRADVSLSLFAPGYTMSSVIANEFPAATSELHVAALAEVGVLLFAVTVAFNVAARLLVARAARQPALAADPGAVASVSPARDEPPDRRALPARDRPVGVSPRELEAAYAARKLVNRLAAALASAAVALALFPLLCIFAYVASHGARALSVDFFTACVGDDGAGMANAIVGTVELVLLASLMGIPLGVAGGLYLSEFRHARLARAVRFATDVLSGVPSILVGVVVYSIVVVRMRHFSAFAGAVALAIVMLPLVTRTTDVLARAVPDSLREAALALGAPRWRTAIFVVLRTAAPGIRSGCMLAVARVCGETAPLLFTAGSSRFFNESLLDSTSTLQMQIFTYTMTPREDWHAQAWAAALVLVAIVVVLSVLARRLTPKELAS